MLSILCTTFYHLCLACIQTNRLENEEIEEIVSGLSTFVMGICLAFNPDTVDNFKKVYLRISYILAYSDFSVLTLFCFIFRTASDI